jgi:hypothetical protein
MAILILNVSTYDTKLSVTLDTVKIQYHEHNAADSPALWRAVLNSVCGTIFHFVGSRHS